ncbi:hypothetical protein I4U23_004114 [Adineta vaga]|nr:hypothetical protein I4U23_004114 [Adineta vaga]
MASAISSGSRRQNWALLISNGNYYRPDNRLSSSGENVKVLSNSLKTIGFNVTIANDLGINDLKKRIFDFSKRINQGDLFLFYFCGHVYQVSGKNYLIPVGDASIEREKHVEEFGIDFEQIVERIVTINPTFANIFILDCCGTYLLRVSSSERKGLQEMKPIEGAFIQFACAANETVRKNFFTKHLLKNLTLENVNVIDIFQRTANDVAQESDGNQKPLSINGLRQSEEVFLNRVRPPPPKWDQIGPNEKRSFLKKQEELRAFYDTFPNIDDVMNRNTPDVKQAEELTKSILSEQPSGDVSERSTLCHAIKNLFGNEDQSCLFFDSRQGTNLYDASANLGDLDVQDKPFVLKLSNNNDFITQKDPTDADYDLKVIKTLDRLIEQKKTHAVVEDILERLSKAHNTNKENIVIKTVYLGTFSIVYSILDLKANVIKNLIGASKKLKEQFKQFVAAKIHPLLFRPAFDISQFDERGNNAFTTQETHEIGPPGRLKTYYTPVGYTRYGLKVLGKFNNDTWLRPFRHPANWYRAFHGTKYAPATNLNDAKDASLVAFSHIHNDGFHAAKSTFHGPGVYCSPKPSFVERGFAGDAEIKTKFGSKKFKIMLQVAVNPDDVKFATDDIWVALHPESIRAYGILIKEIVI